MDEIIIALQISEESQEYVCLPRLFLWFIFTYWRLLSPKFLFTIVEPEKWEGQNGQPEEEHLRC